ncbi:hypothetical protein UFOVP653_65 [uncultured Caudovirales phage]|uniref:Uncharacterized protein n=1 Tax=uncultured Caudovirales phage TaxID=2100421 RepID=A0A6J5N974_9CAUD|nr:hypothetical protein UFOVP653_65 [uncultured Caudovirales phage]
MGTLTTASVIEKVQTVLQDATGVRWSDVELLGWLNDGQRDVVLYKPNAYVKNLAVLLVPGTKQSLPSDGVQLVNIVRNMGLNGTTPGRAVRIAQQEMLDARVPNWHAATAAAEVQHYIYSVLDPKTFYVYPPSTGTGYVEAVYGAEPPDASLGGSIALDNIMQTALIDYMLYRAFSKDTEFADQSRATTHFNAFVSAVTGRAKAEAAGNPNISAPANPSNPT